MHPRRISVIGAIALCRRSSATATIHFFVSTPLCVSLLEECMMHPYKRLLVDHDNEYLTSSLQVLCIHPLVKNGTSASSRRTEQ
jgi:hypothetical protein